MPLQHSGVTLTVKLEGLKEVQEALREWFPDAKARTIMRKVLRNRAKPIAETARGFAPVDPRDAPDLRDSIAVSGTLRKSQRGDAKRNRHDVEVYVGPSTRLTKAIIAYAHLQEFGSSVHGPHPYMRPAWDKHSPSILNKVGEELWKEMRTAAEKAARKAARQK